MARRSEQVRELTALIPQVQDLQVEFAARIRELFVAIELGDFERADATLGRAQAIAEQTRQPTQRWNTGFVAASLAYMRGELETSERLAEQVFQLGQEAGQPDAVMIYGATIVQIRQTQGKGAEVVALVEGMVTQNPGVPAWEAALAYTYCAIDRRTEGAEILARAAAKRFEISWADRLVGLAIYADTAAQTHRQAAAMLYELIEPYADHHGAAGLLWTRPHVLRDARRHPWPPRASRRGLRFRLRLPSPKRHTYVGGPVRARMGGGTCTARRSRSSPRACLPRTRALT